MKNPDEHLTGRDAIELARFNYLQTFESIRFADSKANFVLSLSLAALAASFAALPSAIEVVSHAFEAGGVWYVLGIIVVLLFMGFLIFFSKGIIHLVNVIKPRLETVTKRWSPFYFHAIASMELNEFKKVIQEFTYSAAVDELDDQTYATSRIADAKFAALIKGIDALLSGGLIGLIYVIVSLTARVFISN